MTLFIYPELIYDILIWVIESFQAGGLPLLFGMMIIQALAIPIPSELVLIAGGLAFAFPFGWIVGALGSIVAAFISFYISKKGGRSLAIKLVGEKGIRFADNWFNRWGSWAVLLGRFAPFIPFDAISYSAGLTTMKLKNFMIPTVIGTLPRTLFYTSLGSFFGLTFQRTHRILQSDWRNTRRTSEHGFSIQLCPACSGCGDCRDFCGIHACNQKVYSGKGN